MMLDVWSWAAVVQCSWRGAVVQCSWRGASRTNEKREEIPQGSTADVTLVDVALVVRARHKSRASASLASTHHTANIGHPY